MENNRYILEKFWDGNCTKEELRQVGIWLDTASGRKILDEIIEQREVSKVTDPDMPDNARVELLCRKETELIRHITHSTKKRRSFLSRTALRRVSMAAVFTGIMVFAGTLLWNNPDIAGFSGGEEQAQSYAELTNPNGIPELYKLPDGTKIWLAAGSILKYPGSFSKKRRDVELSGEAFFDVAQDEKRPFTIHSGGMETCVLGTSFKVTAFDGQEQEVSVVTGKVSVSSHSGKELALLTRGGQVRHNPATGETTQAEIDPAMIEQWKSGKLIFHKMPMSLVAKQLEYRYAIEIEFVCPQIASLRVSSIFFPETPVRTIMHVLGTIGNFQYKQMSENHYTIY